MKTEVSASLLLLLQRCLGSLEHSQLEQLQLQQRLLPALKRSRSLASSAQAMVCLQSTVGTEGGQPEIKLEQRGSNRKNLVNKMVEEYSKRLDDLE